jgi:hypothetical protein
MQTMNRESPIPAETLALIAAAAATFVGRRLRIFSIEQVPSMSGTVSRWSRQGRVLVQSSHNLPVNHKLKGNREAGLL